MIRLESVRRYLESKFGDALEDARGAMMKLARSLPLHELADSAYRLYTEFRPDIPAGVEGWGKEGRLDLDRIRSMARWSD